MRRRAARTDGRGRWPTRSVPAGIKGILNFAPITLRLPPHVSLVSVDLAVQLEQLAFLVHLGQNE